MFFAPIIGMVPPQATAPALIIVGFLMMSALTETEEVTDERGVTRTRKLAGIDFTDLGLGLGAALTIILMPFTFSITDGIGFGFIAFTLVRLAEGRWRQVHPLMWAASVAFALYFLVPLLQDTFDWI
jgi:AGZA family xanthine/uracil permease-like MFS transporter